MFNLDRMEHTATRLNLFRVIPLQDLKMLLNGPWGDRNPGEEHQKPPPTPRGDKQPIFPQLLINFRMRIYHLLPDTFKYGKEIILIMIPQFLNREEELRFLEKIHGEEGFKLVVIYGRRRVGKTELIKKFMENKRGCYILLTNESLRENIRYFKECFARTLGREYYEKIEVESLSDLFKYVDFGGERFVLALDEFPYLLEINRGLLSTFQKVVDENLSKTNVMLILSGSSLSMMENDVLGYRSPLYGRNVNVWKLQPFHFRTIYEIFGDIRLSAEVYYVFGSIPYYLTFYDQSRSLEENIREVILTKGMNLYDEPLILLRQEFRESRIYRLILKYISQGYRTVGKLCSATGMDKSNITKYLDTLRETGFVEHILPFGKKRGGVYEISDPFVDFWFRFVYFNRADLEMGNVEKVLSIFRREKSTYFGYKFEKLIFHLMRTGSLSPFRKYGSFTRWWHKGEEIDIVGVAEDTLLVAECKWSDGVDANSALEKLRKKAERIKWSGRMEYAIFAKSFSSKSEGAICYDLKDIERELRQL
ncbi:MAG: ATP-binding protein [Candidatus Marinimicrobia bacterium]|nr:ATP-binding protein [Candidatus Neomarinimicrobiota bacterium]